MRTKRVDAEEKQQIAILAAQGKSQRAIARATGRDNKTVAHVLRDPTVIAMVDEGKERLARKYYQLAETILDNVTYEDLEKASLQQKAIASATMLDKARLITNQSTANIATLFAMAMEDE